MAELTEELKTEVVLRLARFERGAEIIKWLKVEHGLECSFQQIHQYDASKPQFTSGDKWRQIFDAARKAFLHDVAAVPAAQQAYRLNMLQKGIEESAKKGNWPLVSSLLEQAAKEVGGAFTNVRINAGDFQALSEEERRARLSSIIDRAFGRDAGTTAH